MMSLYPPFFVLCHLLMAYGTHLALNKVLQVEEKTIRASCHFSDIFKLRVPSKKLNVLAVWEMLRITKKKFPRHNLGIPLYLLQKSPHLTFLENKVPLYNFLLMQGKIPRD